MEEEMFLSEFKQNSLNQVDRFVVDTNMHVCMPPLPLSTDGTASTEEDNTACGMCM